MVWKKKNARVDSLVKKLDEYLEDLNYDVDTLQSFTEDINNSLCRNNIKLRGLEEGPEASDHSLLLRYFQNKQFLRLL